MASYAELLKVAAGADVPVLLLGESGSGKEVAAHAIHSASGRAKGPFIALNCGAIPSNLEESVLEGSERGSFTGATSARPGLVRAAAGGTLFLDEVGELPLASQARLLRILQERTVLPIGAHQEIPVDFRLICATNRDLPRLVSNGKFREDLLFRINVFPVRLPPLRKRLGELEKIAADLWEALEAEGRSSSWQRQLSSAELAELKAYKWPGNIRQLKNVLQRYHLLKPCKIPLAQILSEERETYSPGDEPAKKRARAPEKSVIERTLRECGFNKSLAARELGISRGSLCYQLRD